MELTVKHNFTSTVREKSVCCLEKQLPGNLTPLHASRHSSTCWWAGGDYPGVTDAEITHTGYHAFDMPAQAALLGGSDGVLGLG